MIVKIVSVTTPDGTPRADDKYPVRIGSTFKVTTRNSVYVLERRENT